MTVVFMEVPDSNTGHGNEYRDDLVRFLNFPKLILRMKIKDS